MKVRKKNKQKRRPAPAPQNQRPVRTAQPMRSRPEQPTAPRPPRPASAPPRQAVSGNSNHAPVYDQDAGRMPPPPQKKRKRGKRQHARITKAEMRRRRFRRRLLAVACLLIAVTAGILLSVTLLFRVTTFEFQDMEGQPAVDTGGYTQSEILQALQVKEGDNLFSFSPAEQEEKLDREFPLLENVKILRRMPSTVILRVQPAEESFCIETNTGWLILSRQCKVIAMSGTQPELPILKGPVVTVPQVGETLRLGDWVMPSATAEPGKATPQPQLAPEQEALRDMLTKLDEYEILGDVTHLDVTEPEQVYFGYQDRIRVVLGTLNQLDYKMRFAVHLLTNKDGNGLVETDQGVLDMSIIRSDGTIRPTFKQCDPELAARQAPEDGTATDDTAADTGDAAADDTTADNAASDDTAAADAGADAAATEPGAAEPTPAPAG